MTAYPKIQYFLGANAPTGFYSLYDQLLPPERARAVYILKGGPGCGKSTLMHRVAGWAEEAGLETEHILCSGGPGLPGRPGAAPAGGRRGGRHRAPRGGAPVPRGGGAVCEPGGLL